MLKEHSVKKIDKDYNKPVDWLIDSGLKEWVKLQRLTHKLLIQSSEFGMKVLKNQMVNFSRVITQSNKIILKITIVYYRDTKLSISK